MWDNNLYIIVPRSDNNSVIVDFKCRPPLSVSFMRILVHQWSLSWAWRIYSAKIGWKWCGIGSFRSWISRVRLCSHIGRKWRRRQPVYCWDQAQGRQVPVRIPIFLRCHCAGLTHRWYIGGIGHSPTHWFCDFYILLRIKIPQCVISIVWDGHWDRP